MLFSVSRQYYVQSLFITIVLWSVQALQLSEPGHPLLCDNNLASASIR